MNIKEINPPEWVVKKAYRSITLYHLYERSKDPYRESEQFDLDLKIVVSFKDGVEIKDIRDLRGKSKEELNKNIANYVEHYFSVNSLKGKKWIKYPDKEITIFNNNKEFLSSNEGVKKVIIDTIFTPKDVLVFKK